MVRSERERGGEHWLGLGVAGLRSKTVARNAVVRTAFPLLRKLSDHNPTDRRLYFFLNGNMADVPQIVKIGISIKMLPNNSAVYFKSDGARFGQTRTIKLLTGSKYKIEVAIKPGAAEAT